MSDSQEKNTKKFSITVDRAPLGKAMITEQDNRQFVGDLLYFEDAAKRVLRAPSEETESNKMLNQREIGSSEEEVRAKLDAFLASAFPDATVVWQDAA